MAFFEPKKGKHFGVLFPTPWSPVGDLVLRTSAVTPPRAIAIPFCAHVGPILTDVGPILNDFEFILNDFG